MSYENNLADDSITSNFLVKLTGFIEIPAKEVTRDGDLFSAPLDVDNVTSALLGGTGSGSIFRSREELATNIPQDLQPSQFASESASFPPAVGEWFYDKQNKIIYSGQNASTTVINGETFHTNNISVFYELYLSVDSVVAHSTPDNSSTALVQWRPLITSAPEITRDVSDFLVGFYPTQTSNMRISSTPLMRNLVQNSEFQNQDFDFFHIIGDPLDVTNAKKIFSGKISGVNYNNLETTFSFDDGSSRFNRTLEHPDNAQDYSDFDGTGTYRVLDNEAQFPRRKIYGVVNGLDSLNIDRPSDPDNPLTTENRIWVWGVYSGSIDDCEDWFVETDESGDLQTRVTYVDETGPDSEAKINIRKRITDATGLTDQDILNFFLDFYISPKDVVAFTSDAYPGETFYPTISDFNTGIFDKVSGDLTYELGFENIVSIISSETGDPDATVRANLFGSEITVDRLNASRLFLRDVDNVLHTLLPGLHYNSFRDPTEKLFGVQLVSNVEVLLGISTLKGSEEVFGRVYGPRADDTTFGIDNNLNWVTSSNFQASRTNSTFSSVLFDYFKKFMSLSDSEINLDLFNQLNADETPSIIDNTTFSTKHILNISGVPQGLVIPRIKSQPMPTVKDQLIELLLPNSSQIFVNNEGKYSFMSIGGYKDEPIYTITDADFELESSEIFEYRDIYGDVISGTNYLEKSTNENIVERNSVSFSTSVRSRQVLQNNISINVGTLFYSDLVTEEANFIFSGLILGSFGATYASILDKKVNIIEIRVSRRFYDVDIGDRIELKSELLGSTYSSGNNGKWMNVVGIKNRIDDIIIKLSDITESDIADFSSAFDPESVNAADLPSSRVFNTFIPV